MLKYFIPSKAQTKLEDQKSKALVWFMMSLILLLFIPLVQALFPKPNFTASDYFLPVGQIFLLSVLFVLKKRGVKLAGQVFSIGGLLIIAIVLNIFDEDSVITKFGEEYYLAILVLVFISLFGTRRILLTATIIIFLSSFRSYLYLVDHFPEQASLLLEGQIYFSVSLISISLILFFITMFADDALATSKKDAEIKEQQNKDLIQARKRAEKSELLYKGIFYNLVGGFYKTDENGVVELVSPSALKITGFNEDEVVGNHLFNFFVKKEEAEKYFETIRNEGKVEMYRSHIRTKNKGNIMFEKNASAVYDRDGKFSGIEGIFFDISQQWEMEIELENYRNNLELLVQQKTEELDASNQELLAINDELSRQNEEIKRQKDLIDEQNVELSKIQDELKMANLTLEEKVKKRTGELEASNKILEKTIRELDRFIYSASHDLGAPLKSIMGLVNIAKMENKDSNIQVHLNYIEESIIKQEHVIHSLIQYSKNDRQELTIENINLYELIEQILFELRYIPGYDEIETINRLKKGQKVNCDIQRIKMILINLLSNSIKYRISNKENPFVKIEYAENDKYWFLYVIDNGQGIDKIHQKKIFDMFYRANMQSDGSGLGLFIVNEAVERLGGKITVESAPDEGSTFLLEIPKR